MLLSEREKHQGTIMVAPVNPNPQNQQPHVQQQAHQPVRRPVNRSLLADFDHVAQQILQKQ